MAGDWIKMRHDLRSDPAVIAVAAALNAEEDLIVGKLHRLWTWADKQTIDGNAVGVTFAWVDRYLGVTNFAQELANVGWLAFENGGLVFPHFDRHIAQSAKRRALTATRVAVHKLTQGALPREEKRREEITPTNVGVTRPRKRAAFAIPSLDEVAAYVAERGNKIDPAQFVDHYTANGWRIGGKAPMRDWKAAVRTWEKNGYSRAAAKDPQDPRGNIAAGKRWLEKHNARDRQTEVDCTADDLGGSLPTKRLGSDLAGVLDGLG